MADNKYGVDYGKRPSGCKKCKEKLVKGDLRIAKITASPFSDDGEMKLFFHPECIFETFKRARPGTKIIEEPGDLPGWESVNSEDKDRILKLIKEFQPEKKEKPGGKGKKSPKKANESPKKGAEPSPTKSSPKRERIGDPHGKDNSFSEFYKLCDKVAGEPSYNSKTEIFAKFFDYKRFKGDLYVWVKMLLPGAVKRGVYNLQSKTLIKIFAKILKEDEEQMLEDLEAGDVAQTISTFYERSGKGSSPEKESKLSLFHVDDFLDDLTGITTEDKQMYELQKITQKCTVRDLRFIIRLIKGDLKIQAGPKHVLSALHPDAYEAFNNSRNMDKVIERILELREEGNPSGTLNVGAALMNPVQPMLAQACKSVDMAFKKFPNGMYSEIKYDGERVQVHKKGSEFQYFSRSLKPVMAHKVKPFKEYIPKAFPEGSDLILDSEVLMVDNKTGEPLPFGSLGVHKASGFKDATPCLFIFDCIYYNGENLMDKPIKERRESLCRNMVEVGNHIKLSEMKVIKKKSELNNMIQDVLRKGLEGLVLKDMNSQYEPGKRHWLKVKKDYLNEGAMADTADLVVLGGWFGTGQKGGMVSIFLMGCYDTHSNKWRTVTKVHGGFDDAALDRLQRDIVPNMKKIKGDYDALPDWLYCNRGVVPDFIVKDPKIMPVWEITGAEFTKSDIHTANGISIRFPRVTKERVDKDWKTATSLEELNKLYKASKEHSNITLTVKEEPLEESEENQEEPLEESEENQEEVYSPKKKIKLEDRVSSLKIESNSTPLMDIEDKSPVKVKLGKSNRSYDKVEIVTKYGLELYVINGDLFKDSSPTASLAHCISADFAMKKGIAKVFKEKFKKLNELSKSEIGVGDVSVLKDRKRFIYNLVTKSKHSDKPTYDNLKKSLEAMRKHVHENDVSEVAMPLIGCGLDGLKWNAVRTLIKNVFLRTEVKITVYRLESGEPAKTVPGSQKKRLNPASDEENSPSKIPFEDPFLGVKIYLKDGLKEDTEFLTRYILSFGGSIVENEEESATHIVYPNDYEGSKKKRLKAVQVREMWLTDSIKAKQILNTNKYRI